MPYGGRTGPSESDFRRPDFVGGVPIELVGGETWYFAEPKLRFVVADNDVGFEAFVSLDDEGRFQRLLQEYRDLVDMSEDEIAMNTDRYIATELRLGRMMLERNYSMPTEKMAEIMQFSMAGVEKDPVATEIRSAVLRVAMGLSPKP